MSPHNANGVKFSSRSATDCEVGLQQIVKSVCNRDSSQFAHACRHAGELLLQRQQEAALALARQRQRQLSAISVHRAAFLAADEEAAVGPGSFPHGAVTSARLRLRS
jgi:hypothetical protein